MNKLFTLLFCVYWLSFLVLLRSHPLHDPGVFWHVRVGEWIFSHGAFPHTDPFTWSYADQLWIPQQWGAECLMAALHRLGGYDALIAAMTALLAVLATWLTGRFLKTGLHPILAVGFVAFGMLVAGFHFFLRPHLVTMVLMAVVLAWLVDYERKQVTIRRWIWFVPLCIFWTNMHGGVLGGIFTVAIACVGWLLLRVWCKYRHLEDPTPAGLGWLGLIVLLAGLSTLINPFGWEMHRTWWRIVGSSLLPKMIDEHMPLNPAHTEGKAVIGFGLFYLLMLAGTLPKRPQITWLLPVVWLVLSIQSIRHAPLFCLTALVALADLFPETIWYRLLKKNGDTFVGEPSKTGADWRGWLIPVALIALCFTLQMMRVGVPVIGSGWARFDTKYVPIEMTEEVERYAVTRPEGFPIFNDANYGGFLIFHAPNLRVYMDDRCELFGDAGLLAYAELMSEHPERIEELADRVGFDRALVRIDSEMEQYLRDSLYWKKVPVESRTAVLYERRTQPDSAGQ
jgi:hypothetical protein